MNVDDMTDEEFIDYCRNGGELSGLITERHPKCDWRSRPAPNVRRYANAHGTRRNTTESAATHCKAYGVA